MGARNDGFPAVIFDRRPDRRSLFAREARFGVPRRVGATERIRRGELDAAFGRRC